MALAFNTVTNGKGGGNLNSTVTVAHTPAGEHPFLVVEVAVDDSNQHVHQTKSVTFNGKALTQLIIADNLAEERAEIWYLANPDLVTANVVVSFDFLNYVGVGVLSFTGASAAAPTLFGTSINSTGANPSITLTPIVDGSMIIDVVEAQSVETVNAGQTLRWQNQGQSYQNGAGSTTGLLTTSATTVGWKNTGGNGVAQAAFVLAPYVLSPIPTPTNPSSTTTIPVPSNPTSTNSLPTPSNPSSVTTIPTPTEPVVTG